MVFIAPGGDIDFCSDFGMRCHDAFEVLIWHKLKVPFSNHFMKPSSELWVTDPKICLLATVVAEIEENIL